MAIRRNVWLLDFLALAAIALPSQAQVSQTPPDPLARIRAAAAADGANQACSISETSACAQANPKILANALASTALAENVRQLATFGSLAANSAAMAKAIAWSETAFRAAGADRVDTHSGNVVAEIRGREKPDEFVIVAANLDSAFVATQVTDSAYSAPDDDRCNAAMLVEAARDIHLTGLRPRRSIRFVIFGDRWQGPGRYIYSQQELDSTVAVAIFEGGCSAITGFNLSGREELEPGVQAALDFAPIKPWGVGKDTYGVALFSEYFDFLLQGIPSLTANRLAPAAKVAKIDMDTLKKNAALAGILAFGLAEHAMPLGPRLTHAETESLLERTGLKAQMQVTESPVSPGATPPIVRETLWDRWQGLRRQP